MVSKYKFYGMWPVAPTPFQENGEVDYEGMGRVIDCLVDQKVEGICILANYSEQFLISALIFNAALALSILKQVSCSISLIIFVRRGTESSIPDKGASCIIIGIPTLEISLNCSNI